MADLLDASGAHSYPNTTQKVALGRSRAVIAVAVFVLVWFQPQKVFIDDKVNEALPTVVPTQPRADDEPVDPAPSVDPEVIATGDFVSLDHGTSGVSRVLGLADGSRIVRLEGFETENGPDLYVYLSTKPADGGEGSFDDDYVSLGRLKGNIGDQNYELASDVEIDRFTSVVIWCDRFNSPFGAANLGPA